MRTSPSWIQHRDVKTCHERSHLLQTCLSHNSAPHPTNARLVTTLSFLPSRLEAVSRFQSKTAGWGRTASDSAKFSEFLSGVRNSYTALLIQLGIPIVSVRLLLKTFCHVVIVSGPLTCNPIEKLTSNTIVAATHGLVLTHDGNAPQQLYHCISTILCI